MLKIKTKIRIASLCLMSLQTATAECYDQHSVEMCDGMACVCYPNYAQGAKLSLPAHQKRRMGGR